MLIDFKQIREEAIQNDYRTPLIQEIERRLIIYSLEMHRGNQRAAADFLQMPKSTFADRVFKYKIDAKKFKVGYTSNVGGTHASGRNHTT